MRRRRHSITAVMAALRTLLAAGALAVLWHVRPGWPDLPPSLDTPLTIDDVQRAALLVLWIALAILALLTLAQAIAAAPTVIRRRGTAVVAALPPRPGPWRPPPTTQSQGLAVSMLHVPRSETPHTGEQRQQPRTPTAKVGTPAAICLLGPPVVRGFKRPRRAATTQLLAYLALRGESTRDQLLEAIWPDQDPRRTKPRLWQSVTEAKRILGDGFVREDDRYRLDTSAVLLDTHKLEQLLSTADRAADPHAKRAALDQAAALWRGQPLDGMDYPWAGSDVRRLESTHVELLERLARACLETGDARGALAAAEQGIQADELHEALWRLSLEAEATLGLREATDRRYHALCRLLDDRLGLQPQQTTVALYHRLLQQS